MNFLLTKFTPKAGQIYPQGVNLPPVKNPWSRGIGLSQFVLNNFPKQVFIKKQLSKIQLVYSGLYLLVNMFFFKL